MCTMSPHPSIVSSTNPSATLQEGADRYCTSRRPIGRKLPKEIDYVLLYVNMKEWCER